MRRFEKLPGELSLLYSPIALLLEDEFTGGAPMETVNLRLQRFDAETDSFVPTDIQPFVSAEGVLSYPGLGRTPDVGVGPRRFRIQIEARLYTPFYRRDGRDGLEFEAYPYNDQHPLPVDDLEKYARGPDRREGYRYLLPGIRYPFSPQTPVLRGTVVRADGTPAVNHCVDFSTSARSVTDQRGQFALPFQRLPGGVLPRGLTEEAAKDSTTIKVDNTEGFETGRVIRIAPWRFTVISVDEGNGTVRLNSGLPEKRPVGTAVLIQWPPPPLWPPTDIHLAKEAAEDDTTIEVERLEGFAVGRAVEIEPDGSPIIRRTVNNIREEINTSVQPPKLERMLTLDLPLPHFVTKGTRIQSLPLVVDISHGSDSEEYPVKVPDDFRRLTIQLP